MIKGGYYIKARCIQDSEIAIAPPHIREIWDWLLNKANHKDKKYAGFLVKRGQLFRTYYEIREGLSWMVGWRKMMYSENQTKRAMKYLRSRGMIDTRKEPRGVLVTICNYNTYQDPKNYESTYEATNEGTKHKPQVNHSGPSINNNDNNDNNVKNDKEVYDGTDISFSNFWKTYDKYVDEKACERKWASMSKKKRKLSIDYIPAYKQAKPDKVWRRDPHRYLTKEVWNNEIVKEETQQDKDDKIVKKYKDQETENSLTKT